jgi:hypothetical protein
MKMIVIASLCVLGLFPARGISQANNGVLVADALQIEKRYPLLCHPDRSVAQWRDLQFRGPLLEMFFERSGEIGCFFSRFS